MKLARFWTRQEGEAVSSDGGTVKAVARGWSNESLEAAAAKARDIAKLVAARIASEEPSAKLYGYGDRPLPEPVLREFPDGSGAPSAVITRNAYGSHVLNARDLMFVDIDREDSTTGGAGQGLLAGVMSLFGKSKPEPAPPPVDPVIAEIQRVVERNNLTVRAYKTAAGYRVLVASRRFEAASAASESLLREFGCDPLYIKLCKAQESFRARLTPKPWRCGLAAPPVSFPFEGPQEESMFRDWDAKYKAAAARFATCRFLGMFGSAGTESSFRELMDCHDRETNATSVLTLA
jgi:hypothetical protein